MADYRVRWKAPNGSTGHGTGRFKLEDAKGYAKSLQDNRGKENHDEGFSYWAEQWDDEQ